MEVPGPTTQAHTQRWAGNLLRLARQQRGWTQRQLAQAAGVPVSTVARIESGVRQPSLVTLSRLLAAADLEMRIHLAPDDDHDDVLDARRAALTEQQRADADAAFTRTTQTLAAAREQAIREGRLPTPEPAVP
jgi:transcriptional regulator with XRE-family HTH domain